LRDIRANIEELMKRTGEQSRKHPRDFDMDDADSTAARGSFPRTSAVGSAYRFRGGARTVALAAEAKSLAAMLGQYSTLLEDVRSPPHAITELPGLGWEPVGPLMDLQPTIQVGVTGGTVPSLGRAMLDTGSSFCLMSTATAKAHSLQSHPFSGSF